MEQCSICSVTFRNWLIFDEHVQSKHPGKITPKPNFQGEGEKNMEQATSEVNRCKVQPNSFTRCVLVIGHESDHKFDYINKEDKEARQIYKGGAAATKIPGFKYIPLCALERLAKRFELGLERHGKNSWNALNPDSTSMLDDKEWLIERLSHAIHHCYKEIEFLTTGDAEGKNIDCRDDNAAAIMWAGACLIAADERRKKIYEMALKSPPQK